jgi:hypothetical protein
MIKIKILSFSQGCQSCGGDSVEEMVERARSITSEHMRAVREIKADDATTPIHFLEPDDVIGCGDKYYYVLSNFPLSSGVVTHLCEEYHDS